MSRITSINQRIDTWLRTNRAWGHKANMEHARYQIKISVLPETRAFWELILERLGDG